MNGDLLGFDPYSINLSLQQILPTRKLPVAIINSVKYKQICSSIHEVGLIEPLSVTRVKKTDDQFMLLDGHIRLIALQDLGFTEAPCLIAKDDESYTYNSRINRLSTIQEHYMIRRAVERGVSPQRLATALNIDISHILKKMKLLDGLCPETIEMLKDRQFSAEISRVLRQMKPTRQVECVELMISANNVTVNYAEALLVATPANLLVDGKKVSKLIGISPEQMARMEREMANLQGKYKLIEQNYGQDVLNLVLARGYLAKLLTNPSVRKYIGQHQPEVLEQFDNLVQTAALDEQ